ncbi:Maf family protein [Azospira inquinata]|uniref:dTTP/UTP pyrophosphatase n=1 Tax=Azospira inquinata TaxID=2785627 RepID=A0A975SKE8_9RHOO|nr:Maf family protein [Azospira inquinata]QWT46700.1 septum formation inhibitor Maf [Azospira inquinata]QWT47976.1 septum formation inhibitor Maf [Azospira inquinata]
MTIPLPPRIYLASHSPRRRELLTQIGVLFDSLISRGSPRQDPEVDETPFPGEDPVAYVQRVTLAKAEHGVRLMTMRHLIAQPVLAADTTVAVDGQILGKPKDGADAERMLKLLSGSSHRVLTALALVWNDQTRSTLSETMVHFRPLEPGEIARYIASGEPMDKAGAYGIQGRAGLFVRRLEGSYSGVMGLPLFETGELLRECGYPL